MNTIIKLDETGAELPADSTNHAILVINGLRIDVRKRKAAPWRKAQAECAAVDLLDAQWRSATVKEIFALTDLTRISPALDPSLFPNFPEYGWIWAADQYAGDEASSPDYAWGVGLRHGDAYLDYRLNGGLALPVSPLAAPAGQ